MKFAFLLISFLMLGAAAQSQLLKKIKDKAKEKVDKTIDGATKENKEEKKNGDESPGDTQPNGESEKPAGIKVYSKYDFVPGERIIQFEDFSQDAVGDFPSKWNTNASGETVTIEGKPGHWLMINKQGVFMPEFIDSLPDDFTLEFDLLCDNPGRVWALYTNLVELKDRDKLTGWESSANRFTFTITPYPNGSSNSVVERRKGGVFDGTTSTSTKQFSDKTQAVHVALWRQKERVRVYFNEEKAWDLPKAMHAEGKYNALVYWLQGGTADGNYYLTNLRLAVGAPDTRKKMLEQNKWVTHGILFDINSDKIKPESYGTLKEMATVLKEYPELKVKIVGHTDSDGGDAANLDLSKKRAVSVKAALSTEFGIDETRMETDGKGESEPIDKNDTSAGKANNRRVEFIKI